MYAAVVPRFGSAVLRGTAPTVYGDGNQTRDFTYVENVVDANLLALTCDEAALGHVYNVACGDSSSVMDLFRSIRECGGAQVSHLEPEFEPSRPGDVQHSLASIEAARRALERLNDKDARGEPCDQGTRCS